MRAGMSFLFREHFLDSLPPGMMVPCWRSTAFHKRLSSCAATPRANQNAVAFHQLSRSLELDVLVLAGQPVAGSDPRSTRTRCGAPGPEMHVASIPPRCELHEELHLMSATSPRSCYSSFPFLVGALQHVRLRIVAHERVHDCQVLHSGDHHFVRGFRRCHVAGTFFCQDF